MSPRYLALALQTRCLAVNRCPDRDSARRRMVDSLNRIGAQIAASKAFIGPDLRLVVLPEYFLTGFPMQESISSWRDKACLAMDDPLYEALGAMAQSNAVYIAGNAYETDPHFPALYFQSCFVIADDGRMVLRYRRLISMYAPTPHDLWTAYLDRYGLDAVFPVARTELGALACVASEEILYPEIARAHVLRGAEILLHSTSEIGSPNPTPKALARRARAVENLCYVVSANTAGIDDIPIPHASTDGMSCIVDPRGQVLSEAGYGESMVAHAPIDLAALRAERRRPGMSNVLARQRLELGRAAYAVEGYHPPDTLVPDHAPERAHFRAVQLQVIERLTELGLLRS